MRAWEIGFLDGLNSWRRVDRDAPVPAYGQVLVRVHAVSLNYRDILLVTGRYGFSQARPDLIPVSDGAGVVIGVGPGVRRWREGDRVAGIFSQSWYGGAQVADAWETTLGGAVDGMLADQVVLDQEGLVRIPDHLNFAQAATLPVAGVTAWNALCGLKPLKSGEVVLTLGTGGVSVYALQLAKAAGATVIITSSSDAKLAQAKALGADHLINYRTNPDWDQAVRRLTDGRGVDHVIEVGGTGTIARSIAATRAGGVVSLIGVLAAGDPIDPVSILATSSIVRGVMVGSREHFEGLNAAMAANSLVPVVDRQFSFDDAPAALAYLASGSHFGKVVVTLD